MQDMEMDQIPSSLGQQNNSIVSDDDGNDWCEDESPEGRFGIESHLAKEWERRHLDFHTMGYRDGVSAGKQASAQEGFNMGFKQSVFVGYNWGVVRGVTSALACLPDLLKDKLVPKQETRDGFQNLHGSVHSISTNDALRLFHEDISRNRSENPHNHSKEDVAASGPGDTSGCYQLGKFERQLEHLITESPALEMHAARHG